MAAGWSRRLPHSLSPFWARSLRRVLLPILRGFTMLFWATTTWSIPTLLILGLSRHIYSRFPLKYDPLYWGAVFPLGMYTACTFRLTKVMNAAFLMFIPRGFVYIALAAWALTLLGLIHQLLVSRRFCLPTTPSAGHG